MRLISHSNAWLTLEKLIPIFLEINHIEIPGPLGFAVAILQQHRVVVKFAILAFQNIPTQALKHLFAPGSGEQLFQFESEGVE